MMIVLLLFLQKQKLKLIVVLKDGGESVVLVVEALVTPVGVDRSSSGRESATRAAGDA
jgi:hypothetical protein